MQNEPASAARSAPKKSKTVKRAPVKRGRKPVELQPLSSSSESDIEGEEAVQKKQKSFLEELEVSKNKIK